MYVVYVNVLLYLVYIFKHVNDSLTHQFNSRPVNKPPLSLAEFGCGKNTASLNKKGFLVYVHKKSVYNICVIVIFILTNVPLFLSIHYAISIFEL